ncbi:MAG TPA: Hpt domain-containing protein [Lentimicrobium sp.]|mgnify:CR=1 FL=1|nr:Hpt domain-containing protein [Lentimicrobium sp.]
MLDKQAFRETYHFLDKEVIIEIIDIFLSEYETKLQKLEQNLADGDLPGIRFTAHNIKGVVSNFNVSELYQQAKELEQTATALVESGGEGLDKEAMLLKIREIRKSTEIMATDLRELRTEMLAE